ncbi:hypothetical protein Pan97_24760 [Bremerella volcania]|uniref:Transposase IS30-like HTH domain-containing protein n=1 Tax=Bremerella volcania TaxID=2527984 RepID=A0A518C8B1_9BACT|nr:helix-turn-helix domain-containing protein [Bremerella volcania]QDU75444.1 hypothetical protein Pan97_24760 [Bremerella volcania]
MNTRTLEHAKVMRIERLLREGFSMRKVARVVGASFNTIARYKRLLLDEEKH